MSGHTWNRPTEREQTDPEATTPVRRDRRGPAPERTDDEQFLAELLDESDDRPDDPSDDAARRDGDGTGPVEGVSWDEYTR